MILDAHGRPVPPAAQAPVVTPLLPFAQLVAAAFVVGLAVLRAWEAAGVLGAACVVAWLLLQVR